eukprot:482287-Hanusia_phi.AAC.1
MIASWAREADILFEGIALTLSSLGAVKGFEFIDDKLVIRLDEFSGTLCLEKKVGEQGFESSLSAGDEGLRSKKRKRHHEPQHAPTICEAASLLEDSHLRAKKSGALEDRTAVSRPEEKQQGNASQGRSLRRGIRQMQLDEKLAKQLQMEEQKSARTLRPK